MHVDDLNADKYLAAFLHGSKNPSDKLLLKQKFRYIECIIRFLNLYCQNELGSGEVDIEKVILWANSPFFENMMARSCRSTDTVYKMLEHDILAGVPLYRLLNISEHLQKVLEQDHIETLQKRLVEDAEKYPCLKCIWFDQRAFSLGTIESCGRPLGNGEYGRRDGFNNYKYTHSCRFCTTINAIPESIQQMLGKKRSYYVEGKLIGETLAYEDLNKQIEEKREKWNDFYEHLDNSVIPASFEKLNIKELRQQLNDDPFSDLARVFGGRQSLNQMITNLQEGLLVKAMIEFVEIYAQTEIGSDYTADIAKIAEFAFRNRRKRTKNFSDEEDVYTWLEEKMANDELNISVFCTRKE